MWKIRDAETANTPDVTLEPVAGVYRMAVYRCDICRDKNNNDYFLIKMKHESPQGVIFAEAFFFNTKKSFFVRKDFWDSAGHPEMLNTVDTNDYVSQIVDADCEVEEYYSNKYGENRKKLKIVGFVVPEKMQDARAQSVKEDSFEDDIPF